MDDMYHSFAVGLVILSIPYAILGWIDLNFATFMVSLACFSLVYRMYVTKDIKK